ncbi:MAG: hypothetical protein JWP11_1340 [Frankiales bacterium]|nr:hypothetical protein [Frankiales bacterium]
MPIPTAPTTAVSGQPIRATAQFNALTAQVNYLLTGLPIAQMYQSVAQSIPTGAFTNLLLDVEVFDRDSGHSTVTNTDRYTAVTAGYYLVSWGVAWSNSTTGQRRSRLAVTTSGVSNAAIGSNIGGGVPSSSNIFTHGGSKIVYLGVNDYVCLAAFQDSGSALNTYASAADQTSYMDVLFISQ